MIWRSGKSWRSRRRAFAGLALAALGLLAVAMNTEFRSPPRFDGAGYAVLGWSLASDEGYREANHPDRPRHAHFPLGYPLALSALYRVFGPSVPASHAFSVICTVGATLAYWVWFRRLYASRTAWLLGAALALNWTWDRTGGAIQSEPLFNLLSGLTMAAAGGRLGRGREPRQGVLLGVLFAAGVLTRHVGVCLAAAVVVDLVLSRRGTMALIATATATCGIAPWVVWLGWVGRGSQARLFEPTDLGPLVGRQALFYARRLPDQILGPFVEVATIYVQNPALARLATAGAALATAVVGLGWLRTLRSPRRRLAGLVPALTLPLLLIWPFTEAGRFLTPLVPFLLIGAVEGSSIPLRRWHVRRPRRRAVWLVLCLSLPYSLYASASGRAAAQQLTHRDFDAACRWIARNAEAPGPILTHYPADVFWLTGRKALETDDPRIDSIERLIARYGVAYLLIDENPFTNAPTDPLSGYVASASARVRRVWGPQGAVSVYAVERAEQGP